MRNLKKLYYLVYRIEKSPKILFRLYEIVAAKIDGNSIFRAEAELALVQ